eukprot:357569-Chlamydomonas_euryale.AAC.4
MPPGGERPRPAPAALFVRVQGRWQERWWRAAGGPDVISSPPPLLPSSRPSVLPYRVTRRASTANNALIPQLTTFALGNRVSEASAAVSKQYGCFKAADSHAP